MNLTQSQAEQVLYVLNKTVKHRKTQPFSTELINFTKTVESKTEKQYHFLSEDYYQYKLVAQSSDTLPFRLLVDSDKADIQEKTLQANRELASIFN